MYIPAVPAVMLLSVAGMRQRVPWVVVGSKTDRLDDPVTLGLPAGTALTPELRNRQVALTLRALTGNDLCFGTELYQLRVDAPRKYVRVLQPGCQFTGTQMHRCIHAPILPCSLHCGVKHTLV